MIFLIILQQHNTLRFIINNIMRVEKLWKSKNERKKEKKIRALFLMCLILPFFVFNVYTTLCLTLWVFRRMRSGANNNHFYFYKLEEVSYMVKPT